MGCCISSTVERRRRNQHHQHHQNHKKKQALYKKNKTQVSKTSIPVQHPPHEVVETLKEVVLSELPNITKTLPKPPPTTTSQQNHSHNQLTTSLQTPPPPPPRPKPSNTQEVKENTLVEKRQLHHHQVEEYELVVTPEVTQVSGIYSITDSYSTATTVTEIREDEATSKRTSNFNHNVKNQVSSSPSSTRRRVHRGRSVSSNSSPAGRERVPVSKRAVSSLIRSNVGPTGGGDGSSSSASRRSPATTRGRGGGMGRGGGNHSEKVTGRGSNRSRAAVGGGGKEGRNGDVSRNNQQQEEQQQREGNNESLHNPLVSLECFIFL